MFTDTVTVKQWVYELHISHFFMSQTARDEEGCHV
jgi:hypothetical protein